MANIYWVGIRKSDLLSLETLYHGSITFFGDGKDGNICLFKKKDTRKNHNIELKIFEKFNRRAMLQVLEEDINAKFMFYNPMLAYLMEEHFREHIICLNSLDILKIVNDKMLCKLWLKDSVQLLENAQMFGKEINLKNLNRIFGVQKEYVIQLPISSGGTGTYIFNEQNQQKIISKILPSQLYTVSPYYKNAISINIHCVIYKNTFQLYPLSIQIIKKENDNLIYKGCDFITAHNLDCEIKRQLIIQAEKICDRLCKNNYRGVCGIDFMLVDGEVYFCEINPRFQASTIALNLALVENSLKSINESTIDAFSENDYLKTICMQDVKVPYSSFAYEKNSDKQKYHKNLFETYFSKYTEYSILKDGYSFDVKAEQGAYLFRAIFPHALTDITNGELRINELLGEYTLDTPIAIVCLKLMLMNFGIKISSEVLAYISEKGNLREGNFSAIDIVLWNNLIVNCPYRTNHYEYSPFSICLRGRDLLLYYFDKVITNIGIFYESKLNREKTSNGIPYSAVAFLATDRLRINYNSVCYYKKSKNACMFCNLPEYNSMYAFDDITQIIEDYIKNESFRHILLGGGSSNPNSSFQEVIKLVDFVKSKTDKPLYLMSLPPQNLEIIDELYNSGISEIAFNIEIFHEYLARQYMPGKGAIPRQHYYKALEKAVTLWGRNGNVRSMVILGLEPEDSLLAGIEDLCKIGVQPILSIFRPMENTPLSSKLPLSIHETMNLYKKIQKICTKYGQILGPSCIYCQNNTLSIPTQFSKDTLLME